MVYTTALLFVALFLDRSSNILISKGLICTSLNSICSPPAVSCIGWGIGNLCPCFDAGEGTALAVGTGEFGPFLSARGVNSVSSIGGSVPVYIYQWKYIKSLQDKYIQKRGGARNRTGGIMNDFVTCWIREAVGDSIILGRVLSDLGIVEPGASLLREDAVVLAKVGAGVFSTIGSVWFTLYRSANFRRFFLEISRTSSWWV